MINVYLLLDFTLPDNPHKEDTFFLFLYIDLVSFAKRNGFVPLFYFLEYPGVLDWFPLKDRTSEVV